MTGCGALIGDGLPWTTLGWIPFIQPMNMFHQWWWLLLAPLCLGISIIYKAVRMGSLQNFWREVTVLTVQIILAMIGLAVCVTVLVQVVIPWLPAE
jgi:hypothetical protein